MDVVYATTAAVIMTPDGAQHAIRLGQHWPADDPVVLAAPAAYFTTDPLAGVSYSVVPRGAEPPVEQTTAAPGERRAAVRRERSV